MAAAPEYDVAIVGGGLAGLATALLLLQANPRQRIVVLDRGDGSTRGQATPERAAYFLGRTLGLGVHLNECHYTASGARFWFAGGDSLEAAGEIGNRYLARLPMYLVDRRLLETEMARRATALGAELRRPETVTAVDLAPGATQTLRLASGASLRARWAVDATGSAALLARQEGWRQPNPDHPVSAVWGRWRGVKDWDSAELRRRFPKWAAAMFGMRNAACNCLTGDGWWSGWVALRGGEASIRVTGDPRLTELPRSATEVQAFLESRHPVAREMLAEAELIDGSAGNDLAFRSERIAGDGFALVGGASGRLDSLYGHDLDWAVSTAVAASELIAGRTTPDAVNADFIAAQRRGFDALLRDKYQYLGEFDLMRVAYLFDLGLYTLCVARRLYREGALLPPPFAAPGWFATWLTLVNRRCAAMARSRRARGTLGRSNAGQRALFTSFNLHPASATPLLGAAWRWLRLELSEGWRTWR